MTEPGRPSRTLQLTVCRRCCRPAPSCCVGRLSLSGRRGQRHALRSPRATTRCSCSCAGWRPMPAAYRKAGRACSKASTCASVAAARPAGAAGVDRRSAWHAGAARAGPQCRAVAVVPDAAMPALGTLASPGGSLPGARRPRRSIRAPTVVLDRVQDPGNVGSCCAAPPRSASPGDRARGTAALWSPKVVRAGMGAHFGLRLIEGARRGGARALEVPLYGKAPTRARRCECAPSPCAFVLGHEGQGVPSALLARCERRDPATRRRGVAQRRRCRCRRVPLL